MKSSVWLSRKGLKWILSCFADIRDWVPGKDLLYKRYRENNKLFEFWGRSNKAGIFADIAMFYGGARRGCVVVPASSNRSGWCLFTKELDSFLSGSTTVWVGGRTSKVAIGGGPTDGGGHNGKKIFKTSNQRELRKFENSRAILGHNVLRGETVVTVSNKNGRPMRDFMFKLTTDNLALRVSKSEGGKRVVSWINPHTSHKSIKSGPFIFKNFSVHDKAHLADLRGKAHVEVSYSVGVGMSVHSDQREGLVGESSRPPMESTVVSVMPEASTGVKLVLPSPDQASELLASNPVASHPDMKGNIVALRTPVES